MLSWRNRTVSCKRSSACARKLSKMARSNPTPQQTVATATSNGQNYITIEPASPEVVYVPQYNPETVWGRPLIPIPRCSNPPGLGLISWGAGFALGAIWAGSWNNWGWNAGWGSNNIFNRSRIGKGNR
jgi:hypothetical protein